MDHEWLVEVKDDAGAAILTARVALVRSSALAALDWPFTAIAPTHVHKGGGLYETPAPMAPAEGDWTLIVHQTGRSPVVQPLKMKAKSKTETLTTPSPKTAATIAFSSELKTVGTSTVRRTRFSVTMYPSSEVVFISGTEYFNAGTRFRIFAESYREGLRLEKKVDAGVIATLFSTDDRSRETHVPAMGGGWLKVATHSFGDARAVTPGRKHAPVIGADVSVVHLYEYLSEVGATEPGRVKNVGFFSHSWPGGPLLYNTGDLSPDAARDPNDFDARMKDFHATNVANWPNLKAAMAPGGSWHVWGCSATTHFKRLTSAAHQQKLKKTGEHQHFTVNTSLTAHGTSTVYRTIEERTTLARIRADMDLGFRSTSYMAAAARFLGIDVFGPPPGVGASFKPKPALMYIDTKTYGSLYSYFKAEFGPEFVPTSSTYDTGYVNYSALAGRAAAAPAPFSSEYYKLDKDLNASTTSLLFANNRKLPMAGAKEIRLKVTAKPGFATAGKSGHLYELTNTDDATLSRAVFVQEDATIFRVDKDAAGRFTVPGPAL